MNGLHIGRWRPVIRTKLFPLQIIGRVALSLMLGLFLTPPLQAQLNTSLKETLDWIVGKVPLLTGRVQAPGGGIVNVTQTWVWGANGTVKTQEASGCTIMIEQDLRTLNNESIANETWIIPLGARHRATQAYLHPLRPGRRHFASTLSMAREAGQAHAAQPASKPMRTRFSA
jgi:hypothetical protein